jgi:hypothetical protein
MKSDKEIVELFKEDYIKNMTEELKEDGHVSTSFYIGLVEDEEKVSVIQVKTNFQDEEDKEMFSKEGIPMICKEILRKIKNRRLVFVSMITEAWMSSLNTQTMEKKEKEDVCIVLISEKDGDNICVYRPIYSDFSVNSEGEMTQNISFEKMIDGDNKDLSTVSTNFSDLYKQFDKHF